MTTPALPSIAVDARYARPPFSGIGRHTLNLLQGLVALPDAEPVAIVVDAQTMLDDTLRDHPLLVPVEAPGSITSPLAQRKLARRLRRAGVQLLHNPDVFGPLLTRSLQNVVTLADVIPLVCRSQLGRSRKAQLAPIWRCWLRAQCAAADAVVTVSQHSADDIAREVGVSPAKLHVIYNSIAGQTPADAPPPAAAPPHEPTILYVGRRDPYKNVPGLVRAFAHTRRHVPDARLVIVGSRDPRYPEAEHEAQRLGLDAAVTFTGFTDEAELDRLYATASLFAFPSLYEGFGLPPLEAMRYGVPVVSSNRSCMPEVLGDAAHFVDPEDAEAFGRAMADILTKSTLATQLQQRGFTQLQRYAPTEQAKQTRTLWQHLLAK